MNPKIVDQPEFRVVGIAARTSNSQEMAGKGRIAELWGRFFQESVASRIPDKLDDAILAVYTDYAGDHNGEYTLVIGARVTTGTQPPTGMVAKTVPAGHYTVLTSEKGPVERVVPAAWQKIWSTAKSTLGGERGYVADFEVYHERAANPADAQVDIYIEIN